MQVFFSVGKAKWTSLARSEAWKRLELDDGLVVRYSLDQRRPAGAVPSGV